MGLKKVQKDELTAYVIYPDDPYLLDWLKVIIRFEHFAYNYIIVLKQKDYSSFKTKKDLRAGYMEDRVCGYKLSQEDNKTKAQLEIGLQDLYGFAIGCKTYENFAEFFMELAQVIQEIVNHKRKIYWSEADDCCSD